MPLEPNGPAPYAPTATILEVIERYRERGLQTPFTLDVLMRAGVTESLAPRTFQSLRLLDLIDEAGNPTDAFEGLRRAPSDQFQERLAEILQAVYADVFRFADPAQDSAERIADAFREYTPPGQRNRMVTLFLGLCEAAGIVEAVPRRARSTLQGQKERAPQAKKRKPRQDGRDGERKQVQHSNVDIPPEIVGLLNGLPSASEGWTKDRRDQFLQTFAAVLDFVIPIKEPEMIGDDGTESEGGQI